MLFLFAGLNWQCLLCYSMELDFWAWNEPHAMFIFLSLCDSGIADGVTEYCVSLIALFKI